MKAKDKVIIVTGGGNGIGRQVVLQLLHKGAKVFAIDISANGLQETKRLSKDNENLVTRVVDISSREGIEDMAQVVIDSFGQIDG